MGHIEPFCGGAGRDSAAFPLSIHSLKGVGALHRLSAKMDAALLRRRDSLRLTLFDELALGLGDVAQKLSYDVGDQRTGQVASLPRVQQRHIQHDNVRLLLLCDDPPLVKDFVIVPAQPVDALDD